MALSAAGSRRPVLLSLIAVDATSLADWVDGGPLTDSWQAAVRQQVAAGWPPDLVLWQQGEADARAGTPAAAYARRLLGLAQGLRDQGVRAPVLVADSTTCRQPEGIQAVRDGRRQALQADRQLRPGPDLDSGLTDGQRLDGCHLNRQGLAAAASAWAAAILREAAA